MRTLVTGASKGIGRAVALRLAVPGAMLGLCASSNSEELAQVVSKAISQGADAIAVTGDLAAPDVPGRIAEQTIATFGGLDNVVSNAGISIPSPLAETSIDDWDHVFAVNVRAALLLAQSCYSELKKSHGCFLAIASMSGVQPYQGMGPYSPSKAALIMLVRQLAQEWVGDGIRVNAISPGLFRTALTEKIYADEEITKKRESLVPAKRIGDPVEDLAGVVEFLLCSQSNYLSGQNIVVDGGLIDSIQSNIAGRPATKG